MKVCFLEPPPALRVGGLEGAIRSLENALRGLDIEVLSGPAADPLAADAVHFHGLWQPAHARLSRQLKARGIPMVVSPHGMLEPWAWRHKWWKKWPYYYAVERAHLRRASAVLATAPPEARRLQARLPAQRVEMLPLGFTGDAAPDYAAARATLGWGPEETVLLFLSRLHVKKGLELLLRGLAATKPPTGTRLVVVGGGEPDYVARVKALAAGLPLPPVEWAGEIWGEARWPYFQGADLFCLPTYSENFGLAVLEACQVGTPALTTDTTPWGDWLQPDRGIIVQPAVASVQAGLLRFFAQPRRSEEARADLARWARQEFSWSALAPRYAALYAGLC